MPEEIGLFEAIDTQRALRYFKPDPVPEELITRILRAGIGAPSGSNSQGWAFIVIRDQETRNKIGEYSRKLGLTAPEGLNHWQQRMYRGAVHLAHNMEKVPVYILVCSQEKSGGGPGGSAIYPAVQNMLLAARGLGLASVLVTRNLSFEADLKRDLGIPDDVNTHALLPIGYPAEGVKYGPTRRSPVEEVAHSDRWGEPWK